MKQFKFIGGFILLLLTMIIGTATITSCHTGPLKNVLTNTEATSDTVIAPTQELGFTNCIDIVQYHDDLIEAYEEDSVFRSMSTEIVTYVAAVLWKENKNDYITVSDIVRCYLANRTIFDAIRSASDEKLLQITVAAPSTVDSLLGDSIEAKTIPKIKVK